MADDNEASIAWIQDPRNPFNWSQRRKWTITVVACLVCVSVRKYANRVKTDVNETWFPRTFLAGLNSTAYTTIAVTTGRQFGIDDTRFQFTFFAVTAWNLAAAVVPMIILPLMETYGMRPGYLICYAVFFAFVVPQALAQNFATLLVCRFLAGAFGGVLQNAVDGIIASIWQKSDQTANPVTLYIFALLGGVTLGPMQAAVVAVLDWRWVFYIELIVYGAAFPLVLLAIREVRAPVILSRNDEKLENTRRPLLSLDCNMSEHVMLTLRKSVGRSIRLLTTEPTIFFFTLWSAFAFGIVFMSTQSVELVFGSAFGFKSYQSGIVQSALAVGELVGVFVQTLQNDRYKKFAEKANVRDEEPRPEKHLYLSIPAGVLGLSGGLFWYAWSSYQDQPPHWIIPCIGLGFVGFGIMSVVTAVSLYITQAYQAHAASAIAAVAFGENSFAAFLPFAVQSMYRTLGFQWASSLLAFVALGLTCAPIILIFKGQSIRAHGQTMKSDTNPQSSNGSNG